jgi:hypothetical protein
VSQLTRSIQDRLFIGILSLIFAPACAYLLIFWRGRPWMDETDWVIRLLALIRVEGISAVFSVALFGIVWAVWTPDWIERRLKRAFWHFFLLVFAVSVLVTCICFYMLFAGSV